MGGAMSCTGSVVGGGVASLCGTAAQKSTVGDDTEAMCSVSAEVYKLSEDHHQWQKIHPSVVAITVRRHEGAGDDKPPLLQLSAAELGRHAALSLPLSQDNEIRRYSDRFLYWRAPAGGDVFALNVATNADVAKLLRVANGASACAPSSGVQATRHLVDVHVAPLYSVRHGRVVDGGSALTYSKCFLHFRPPDELRMLDEYEHCIVTASTMECVLSVDCARLIALLSFPSRAFSVQFAELGALRDTCRSLLNHSSAALIAPLTTFGAGGSAVGSAADGAGPDVAVIVAALQLRLDAVNALIAQVKVLEQKRLSHDNGKKYEPPDTKCNDDDMLSDANAVVDEASDRHYRSCDCYNSVRQQQQKVQQNGGRRTTADVNGAPLRPAGRLRLCVRKLATDEFDVRNARDALEPPLPGSAMTRSLNAELPAAAAVAEMTRSYTVGDALGSDGTSALMDACYFQRRAAAGALAPDGAFVQVLHLIKYALILRISALKNLLPYTDFTKMVLPVELYAALRANVASDDHVIHYAHLDCVLHSAFSLRRQLDILSRHTAPTVSARQPSVGKVNLATGGPRIPNYANLSATAITQASSSSASSTTSSADAATAVPCSASSSNDEDFGNIGVSRHMRICDDRQTVTRLLNELLDTESAFVANLDEFLNMPLLEEENKQPLRNVAARILRLHRNFLSSLLDVCGDKIRTDNLNQRALISYGELKNVVTHVGALFINNSDRFKIYSKYAAAHMRARRSSLRGDNEQERSFANQAIRPLQRVLKYPLFLERLAGFCKPGSAQRLQINSALERMRVLAAYLNQMQRIHEEYGEQLEHVTLGTELHETIDTVDLRKCFSAHKIVQGVELDLKDLLMFAKKRVDTTRRARPAAFSDDGDTDGDDSDSDSGGGDDVNNSSNWRQRATDSDSSDEALPSPPAERRFDLKCCHEEIQQQFVRAIHRAHKITE